MARCANSKGRRPAAQHGRPPSSQKARHAAAEKWSRKASCLRLGEWERTGSDKQLMEHDEIMKLSIRSMPAEHWQWQQN